MSWPEEFADGFDRDLALESIFLLLVLLWTLYVIRESLGFEKFFAWILPLLVAVPLLVVALVQIGSLYVGGIRSALGRLRLDASTNIDDIDDISSGRDTVVFVGSTLAYVLLAQLLGFFLAMPIYLFSYFQLYDSFDWKKSAVITVLVWFGVSFILGSVFAVPGVYFGPFSELELNLF